MSAIVTDMERQRSGETPRDVLRPLRRVRQYREFTREPLTDEEIHAIVDVARWSGSSTNSQPWRFIVIRDPDVLARIAEIGMPQTRGMRTAPSAIAIAMPDDEDRQISYAYDEGRVAERILIAASMLGLGAGISWIRGDVRPHLHALIGVPEGRFVRTIMVLGHPSDAAREPKSRAGEARKPRDEIVLG
jgi:nitroreductase